jgi:hypothetical protein
LSFLIPVPYPHPLFTCPRAVQKDAQAQGLGAFGVHQPALAADVIDILEAFDLGFIPFRIALQAGEPILEGTAESGTDFEAFFAAERRIL